MRPEARRTNSFLPSKIVKEESLSILNSVNYGRSDHDLPNLDSIRTIIMTVMIPVMAAVRLIMLPARRTCVLGLDRTRRRIRLWRTRRRIIARILAIISDIVSQVCGTSRSDTKKFAQDSFGRGNCKDHEHKDRSDKTSPTSLKKVTDSFHLIKFSLL